MILKCLNEQMTKINCFTMKLLLIYADSCFSICVIFLLYFVIISCFFCVISVVKLRYTEMYMLSSDFSVKRYDISVCWHFSLLTSILFNAFRKRPKSTKYIYSSEWKWNIFKCSNIIQTMLIFQLGMCVGEDWG